ncbi:hypothetical protein ACQUW5_07165 [Legionella sp. CNM-1927-20]|uniref:hypothetical protein n=1 Tax=Legionella sp. CNM-1927-20 TaxID=3422221 RepID=UPI00403AD690
MVDFIGLPKKEKREFQKWYLEEFLSCLKTPAKLNQCFVSRYIRYGATEDEIDREIDVIKFCHESFDERGKYVGAENDRHNLDYDRFTYFFSSNNAPRDPRDSILCDRDRFLLDIIHFHLATACGQKLGNKFEKDMAIITAIKDKAEQEKSLESYKKGWLPVTTNVQAQGSVGSANLAMFYSMLTAFISSGYIDTYLLKPFYNFLLPAKEEEKEKGPLSSREEGQPLFQIEEDRLESPIIETEWNKFLLLLTSADDEEDAYRVNTENEKLKQENEKLKQDNRGLQTQALGAKIGLGIAFAACIGIGGFLGTILIPIPGVGTATGMILGGLIGGGGTASLGFAGAGIFNFATGQPKNGLGFTTLAFASGGAIGGAFLGTVFIPIPIVGTLIGAAAGALLGAAIPITVKFAIDGVKWLHNKYKNSKGANNERIQIVSSNEEGKEQKYESSHGRMLVEGLGPDFKEEQTDSMETNNLPPPVNFRPSSSQLTRDNSESKKEIIFN